jgi:hypothetical protein
LGANPALEAKINDINTSVDTVEKKCGVSSGELTRFVDILSASATPALLIGKEIVQSSGASYKLLLLSAINYLANGRIYLLSGVQMSRACLIWAVPPTFCPATGLLHMRNSERDVKASGMRS